MIGKNIKIHGNLNPWGIGSSATQPHPGISSQRVKASNQSLVDFASGNKNPHGFRVLKKKTGIRGQGAKESSHILR